MPPELLTAAHIIEEFKISTFAVIRPTIGNDVLPLCWENTSQSLAAEVLTLRLLSMKSNQLIPVHWVKATEKTYILQAGWRGVFVFVFHNDSWHKYEVETERGPVVVPMNHHHALYAPYGGKLLVISHGPQGDKTAWESNYGDNATNATLSGK